MYPSRDQQGQLPPHQSHQSPYDPRQPPTSPYPPIHDYQDNQASRAHQAPHAMSHMVALPPQSDLYQLPGPHNAYRGPPPVDYRGPSQHMTFNQPAPRQRTAIACRYCRRRKIRCHGFESSEDGRCTNCHRFHQECIFTPVSSQAQAFVPAHTAYPQLRNAGGLPDRGHPGYPQNQQPIIYGPHGHPLRGVAHPNSYPPEPGYALSSPASAYPRTFEEQAYDAANRRRAQEEQHPPSLPPPLAGTGSSTTGPARIQGRRGSSGEFQHLDPSLQQPAVSPASSATSYQTAYSAGGPHSYYPADHRRSPPFAPHDRASNSPRESTPGAFPPGGLQPGQAPPAGGTTPPQPPSAGTAAPASGERRAAMNISSMIDGSPGPAPGPSRSAADSSMLNALMPRRGM